MPNSPYHGKTVSKWSAITDQLIAKHPIKSDEIVKTVLKSWNDIFKSKIGSFSIGKEIEPVPQIMSFLLHELVAHYLSLKQPGLYKVGTEKTEKDIHCITDSSLSIEIKGSSHPNQIFANRSYAQPLSGKGQKDKNGYYIAINFEQFKDVKPNLPKILLIRFGYLEHTDWIAQNSATGQQARLSADAYKYKLKQIYPTLPETM
ncbi:MAG: ScaI family restriction endonuclease [Sphingobacteriales bacterium]|nr:ScaI family restriction endonuclease [Sphingobacteriales bacterium]MBI3717937.1 ScaI family restriction endonuclease [Sphingobacteriales bacterium]